MEVMNSDYTCMKKILNGGELLIEYLQGFMNTKKYAISQLSLY